MARPPEHSDQVRRLLLRGPNWLGDAVLCEPAVAAVRKLVPQAEITLLVKSRVADLFVAHPDIDRILVYQDPGTHSSLAGKWALASTLRQQRFDMAILFQNALEAALLTLLAGIPRRYGYATDARSLFLTDPIPVPDPSTKQHQADYFLGVLRPLGLTAEARSPRLYLTSEEEGAANGRLAEAGVGENDFLIGLNPGSTYGGAKRWVPERFAEAVDRLVRDMEGRTSDPVRVVIVGASGEEPVGDVIADTMRRKPLKLTGKTSVRELMAVVRRCGLFLTNDTGPMHIATAFGVPVIAVFGPTDWRVTSPYGGKHEIVRHDVACAPCLLRECPLEHDRHACMTKVTVDDVYKAAARVLQVARFESWKVGKPESGSPQPSTFQPSNLQTSLRGVTVFLDRDGTMNRDTGYIKCAEDLELYPGVIDAVARLNQAGARVVLVTNQSGVGRGLFSRADLDGVHARLQSLLKEGGASLDAIYYCPHHPEDQCVCRKPRTGMVDRAVQELGVDRSRMYVVGDQPADIQLAANIGSRAVLVSSGPLHQDVGSCLETQGYRAQSVVASLAEAVDWIMLDACERNALNVMREA